jgi:serine/threonine protein kinase
MKEVFVMQHDQFLNQKLNNYGIKYRLGKGAFATVYAAEDLSRNTSAHKTLVALKIPLNQNISYRKQLAEAELLMELDHPNIVKVLSIEYDRVFNVFFFVMELLKGKPLEEILYLKGKEPCDNAFTERIISQLFSALEYCAERNMLHRDIKPGNIVVLENNHIKVMDFGFAGMFGELDKRTLRAGTLYYMPHEQIGGKPELASDVWGAGVILYRMLTGQLPFIAPDEKELIQKIKEEDFAPIKELNPNAADHLVAICNECLIKEPSERYKFTYKFAM